VNITVSAEPIRQKTGRTRAARHINSGFVSLDFISLLIGFPYRSMKQLY